jgi:multidrug efflux system membrane fusion protein
MREKITGFLQSHKKPIAIFFAVVFVALIGRALYKALYKPKVEKTAPYVRTITVGEGNYTTDYTYPGTIRGKYESSLAFQVSGRITQRNVNLGDQVRAGDILMVIDPKDVQQEVDNAQAAVNSAVSNAKLARDNARRYHALYNQGAVSESVWDSYRTQHEAAEAALAQAQAQLATAMNQLGYTQLTADHDGVVSSVTGEVGQVAAAGSPMVTVVQDGNREIEIYVPEGRLNTIAPDMPCTITFWALNDVTAEGTIRYISPMADAATKTYKVRIALPAMPEGAKLGMTAKVSLGTANHAAIVIPRSALYETSGTTEVWVVKDGKVSLVPVVLGPYQDDNVTIKSGLSDGDIVVTAGISKLREGMEVKLEGSAS